VADVPALTYEGARFAAEAAGSTRPCPRMSLSSGSPAASSSPEGPTFCGPGGICVLSPDGDLLPDENGDLHRLSDLQGDNALVLHLSRGMSVWGTPA
jgi:hypothetical protein